MDLHPILRPPTRVSRLYPILTLALMIGSSTLVYAWQNSSLSSDAAIRDREVQINQLKQDNDNLTKQTKNDAASLQTQKTQIDSLNSQLTDIESQLADKTKALQDASTQLQSQKDQLAANSSELQQLRDRPPLFSFQNQSSLTNIDEKEAEIKSVVSAAYDEIQKIYGKPYLLHSITITFVDQFTISGASGEIQITNSNQGISIDIHIKDFDKTSTQDVNTIIHEMVHGFRGIAVIDPSALEEGSTVAATDVVMANMIKDGKLDPNMQLYLNTSEQLYQAYNSALTVYADNNSFYHDPNVAQVYQLIGTAWMKLYKQDHDFFLKFNNAYYAQVQKGQKVDPAAVRDIIASIVSSVDGTPITQFLQTTRAFNPTK